MNITTIGIDLAKNSFSVIGMNANGKVVCKKTLSRQKLTSFIAQQPPCLIGMEACGGAHFWAREFTKLGHKVGIMAAKFVEPYRKGGKNDINDAMAICEAVGRPNMRFVPVKTIEQQAVLCLHRARNALIHERTALMNQLRGLLAEFGIVLATGKTTLIQSMPDILEDADNELPHHTRLVFSDIYERIKRASAQISEYDKELVNTVKHNEQAMRIVTTPGVGFQTASAVVASVPDPFQFKSSRQFCAWLGLVPRQYTTGGKIRLGRITKRGDKYLRMCLVHGARAVVARAKNKTDKVSRWIMDLIARRGYLRAVVAVAARNARLIWTLMVKQENYRVIEA